MSRTAPNLSPAQRTAVLLRDVHHALDADVSRDDWEDLRRSRFKTVRDHARANPTHTAPASRLKLLQEADLSLNVLEILRKDPSPIVRHAADSLFTELKSRVSDRNR